MSDFLEGQRAPYFCRSTGSVMPEGWPEKGEGRGKHHDISAMRRKFVKLGLKLYRAEYLKERGEIVRRMERENAELQQGENLLLFQ